MTFRLGTLVATLCVAGTIYLIALAGLLRRISRLCFGHSGAPDAFGVRGLLLCCAPVLAFTCLDLLIFYLRRRRRKWPGRCRECGASLVYDRDRCIFCGVVTVPRHDSDRGFEVLIRR